METVHLDGATDIGGAIVDHLRHLLPAQGPIGVFVHHNTLHAYEHLPFEKGVIEAAKRLGTQPFMPLPFYRAEFARGRISREDLEVELGNISHEGEVPLFGGRLPLHVFRRLLLTKAVLPTDAQSARFFLEHDGWDARYLDAVDPHQRRSATAETVAWLGPQLRGLKDPLLMFADPNANLAPDQLVTRRLGVVPTLVGLEQALVKKPDAAAVASLLGLVSRQVAEVLRPTSTPERLVRVRDRIVAATARDPDDLVLEALVPVLAAYLDQGLAYWPMGYRKEGLYVATRELVFDLPLFHGPFFTELRRLVTEDRKLGLTSKTSLEHSLAELGYSGNEIVPFLEATILALPGWAGMINCLEKEPELAPYEAPPATLEDFLAVRLLFDRAATAVVLREEELTLADLSSKVTAQAAAQKLAEHRLSVSFGLYQLISVAGFGTSELFSLSSLEWQRAVEAFERFTELEQRGVFHRAYERNYRLQILTSVAALRTVQSPASATPAEPKAQMVFCMDDREESTRRHIEELDPTIETLGAGGFFGVAVAYRGIDDGYFAALCPVVQKPGHQVQERHVHGQSRHMKRYLTQRKLFSMLTHGTYVGTRGLFRGFFATFVLGLFSLFPLTMRVLAPRKTKQMQTWINRSFFPKPETELALQRDAEERGSLELFPGFTSEEMADRVTRVLEDTGLVGRTSRLVLLIGHGSTSLNNPYASAYDCGACGGRKGAPNARLFAKMANDPSVRDVLAARGRPLPESSVFVGVYHDTCTDQIEYFDTNAVPESHRAELREIVKTLDQARVLDAHERSRRFESAAMDLTPESALAHVEGRSENLAEPRPELGHATNAVAIFGRRGLSRGLFLDRRAFLISYDPTQDPSADILGRLLAAMGPVGAGINLEYYFSRVDSNRYGSGTKLPHNVVGLLGVMNGPLSDLRTGLPEQMTEIHEPIRLLVICEATPERIQIVAEKYPAVRQMVENQWIQLAIVDPETGEVREYTPQGFRTIEARKELPAVARSRDWYFGHRNPLPPAILRGAKVPVAAEARA